MDVTETVKFFTPEQTAIFLAYIEKPYAVHISGHKRIDDTGQPYTVGDYTVTKTIPEQIRILFNLAIYTGLRKGELLALQWEDINCHDDLIQVRKSVTMVGGKPVCKAPKTKTSTRTVSIPHFLSERLEQLRESQDAFKAKVGDYWRGDNWVFTQDNGRMMNYSTPYQALQDTINRYNKSQPAKEQLPLIPFHRLRHPYVKPTTKDFSTFLKFGGFKGKIARLPDNLHLVFRINIYPFNQRIYQFCA